MLAAQLFQGVLHALRDDVSLDPLARNTAKPTTSWPSSLARVRASPAPSRRTAISSSRVQRPSGNAMGVAPSACIGGAAERAYRLLGAGKRGAAAGDVGVGAQQLRVDLVRAQPQCLQPVGAQGDPDFALHPPRRCTFCTPGTDSSSRLTTSSTNHETSTRPRAWVLTA